MDRMEEYKALLTELEVEPETLSGSVARAGKRAKRERIRRRIVQSVAGFATMAACFVLAVNLCTPIALACGRVPILRELAQAVIVSPSLSAAVANEHVQLIGKEQTVNGYTLRLEYVIADKRQINIFYTVEGEYPEGEQIDIVAELPEDAPGYTAIYGMSEVGEMDYLMINFDEDTPKHLDLLVKASTADRENRELAEFQFSLDLDPYLLSLGRTVEVNRDFLLDGNTLTISTVEIYPTHMRVNVEQQEDNPDLLKQLTLTIDGDGKDVERVDNKGLISTGGGKYGTYSIYTASSWYYGCEELTFTISGAAWLDKERQETVVDLVNLTAVGLPDGVEFDGIVPESDPRYHPGAGTLLYFTCRNSPYAGTFEGDFRGEDETIYPYCHMSWTGGGDGLEESFFGIGDYSGDTVILFNSYSHVAEYEEPLVLTVDVAE